MLSSVCLFQQCSTFASGRKLTTASLLLFAMGLCGASAVLVPFESLNLKVGKPLEVGDPSPSGPERPGQGGGKGKAIGAAAGAATAGALAKAGCRSAEREGAAVAIEGGERAGLAATSRGAEDVFLARSAVGPSSSAFHGLAYGSVFAPTADIAEKASYLEIIGPAIEKTAVASGKSDTETALLWSTKPEFRAEAISEIAVDDPEELAALVDKKRLAQVELRPVNEVFDDVDPVVHRSDAVEIAIKTENVELKSSAAPISSDETELFQTELRQIVTEVVQDLPKGTVRPTNSELRVAISKALKAESKWQYSFNAQDGKLTLKLQTDHGEITAEPNIYKIVRKAVYLGAVYTGVYNKNEVVQLAKRYFGPSER